MAVVALLKTLLALVLFPEFITGEECLVDYPWTHKGPGICFFATSEYKAYYHAHRHCKSLNANFRLPIVKDFASIKYLHDELVSLGKTSQVWLGLRKSGNSFKWNDGTLLPMNDSKWGSFEPTGNGNCVSLTSIMKTVQGVTIPTLDDDSCGKKKLVICSCKTGTKRDSSSVEKLFKDSPSLSPYQDEYLKKIAAGGNPVFELENVGLKAAMDLLKSSSSDVTETAITDSMKMEIRKFTIATFTGQKFTSLNDKASLELPASAIQATNESAEHAATVGIAYSKIENSNDLQSPTSFSGSTTVWQLDSDVITFSVVHDSLNLTEPVVMQFTSKRDKEKQEESKCAFWNTTLSKWSQEGCYKMTNDSNVTICHCYHLTTFASLMQVSPTKLSTKETFAINVVSYICFGLSYFGLFITIMGILISKSISKPSSFIHFNLCVAILLGQSTFLAGITSTSNMTTCRFVAALLHFFYLSVACWMLVEGIFLLRMTRRVFNTSKNAFLYCLIGWGLPAFIVVVLFSILNKSYGYETACWLNKETGAIWAFTGPVTLIVIFNIVVLVVAIRAALNIRMNRSKSEKEKIIVSIKAIAILLPLLGISWIFGVLAIGPAAKVMQILFAVCNGLQGFFIFLFHCIRNPELKNRRATRQTYFSGSGKNKVGPHNSSSKVQAAGKS